MTALKLAIERAREKAQEVLAQTKRKTGAPVDVFMIAKKYGAEVRQLEFLDNSIAGFLNRTDASKPIIAINKKNSEERKRFTVAHELGHLLLHASEALHVDKQGTATSVYFRNDESSRATRINEIEANQFAAELLMPTKEVFEIAKKSIEENPVYSVEDVVIHLAKQYEVSAAAMSIKLGVTNH